MRARALGRPPWRPPNLQLGSRAVADPAPARRRRPGLEPHARGARASRCCRVQQWMRLTAAAVLAGASAAPRAAPRARADEMRPTRAAPRCCSRCPASVAELRDLPSATPPTRRRRHARPHVRATRTLAHERLALRDYNCCPPTPPRQLAREGRLLDGHRARGEPRAGAAGRARRPRPLLVAFPGVAATARSAQATARRSPAARSPPARDGREARGKAGGAPGSSSTCSRGQADGPASSSRSALDTRASPRDRRAGRCRRGARSLVPVAPADSRPAVHERGPRRMHDVTPLEHRGRPTPSGQERRGDLQPGRFGEHEAELSDRGRVPEVVDSL